MLPFYQIFRIVKAHKEILFKFYHFFSSRSSLWRNHFMFEKSMYFPVIPDNSYVFYEIIFWRHGSMNHVSSIMPAESRWGEGTPHMKGVGMLVVSLRVVNFGFWAHLGCAGQNATMFRLGLRAKKYIEDITRWREDMNFIFEWQNNILSTSAASE